MTKPNLLCVFFVYVDSKDISNNNAHLSLQSGHNLFTGLHNSIQFPRHHDGKALVLSHGEFQVCTSFVHDVNTHFSLVSLSKLVHVLVLALLQRHMEHLGKRCVSKVNLGFKKVVMFKRWLSLL